MRGSPPSQQKGGQESLAHRHRVGWLGLWRSRVGVPSTFCSRMPSRPVCHDLCAGEFAFSEESLAFGTLPDGTPWHTPQGQGDLHTLSTGVCREKGGKDLDSLGNDRFRDDH